MPTDLQLHGEPLDERGLARRRRARDADDAAARSRAARRWCRRCLPMRFSWKPSATRRISATRRRGCRPALNAPTLGRCPACGASRVLVDHRRRGASARGSPTSRGVEQAVVETGSRSRGAARRSIGPHGKNPRAPGARQQRPDAITRVDSPQVTSGTVASRHVRRRPARVVQARSWKCEVASSTVHQLRRRWARRRARARASPPRARAASPRGRARCRRLHDLRRARARGPCAGDDAARVRAASSSTRPTLARGDSRSPSQCASSAARSRRRRGAACRGAAGLRSRSAATTSRRRPCARAARSPISSAQRYELGLAVAADLDRWCAGAASARGEGRRRSPSSRSADRRARPPAHAPARSRGRARRAHRGERAAETGARAGQRWSATTLALRGRLASRPSSPKWSPGSRVCTSRPAWNTRALPARTKNMSTPGSPSRRIDSPPSTSITSRKRERACASSGGRSVRSGFSRRASAGWGLGVMGTQAIQGFATFAAGSAGNCGELDAEETPFGGYARGSPARSGGRASHARRGPCRAARGGASPSRRVDGRRARRRARSCPWRARGTRR